MENSGSLGGWEAHNGELSNPEVNIFRAPGRRVD